MVRRSDFGGDIHARFALDAFQPCDACASYPLESARLGAGFPEPRAEDADPFVGQLAGRGEGLFLGLGAARSGDDQRAAAVGGGQTDGFGVGHGAAKKRDRHDWRPPDCELSMRLELTTSSLPRKCSTTELRQHSLLKSGAKVHKKNEKTKKLYDFREKFLPLLAVNNLNQ